ncbi:MAG TPA: hypothetical protein V6C65_04040 [Allocoleopsis sp.]
MNRQIIELCNSDPTVRGWLKHWDAKNITWEQALEEIGKSLKQETLELISQYEAYPKPQIVFLASLSDVVEYFDRLPPEERILKLAQLKTELQATLLKLLETSSPPPIVVPIDLLSPEVIEKIKKQCHENNPSQ